MFDFLNYYNIFFNFLSFGSLLISALALFFYFFLLSIKDKSEYTKALANTYLLQAFFYSGYFFSAVIYHPIAANHRLLTVGFIYPALLYYLQFILLYPENTWVRFQKFIKYTQWIVGLAIVGIFFFETRTSEYKFHFTGHYWDFDVEHLSKIVAYFILLYILLIPIVGVIRAYKFRQNKKHRNLLLLFVLILLIGTLAPGILNTLSRDGVVGRDVFLNTLTLSVVTMLFLLAILYINTTDDRTTFMAKIVGITLVTFSFLMQGVSYFTLNEKEKEYDELKKEHVEKAILIRKYHPEMVYLFQHDLNKNESRYLYTREDYFFADPKDKVNFSLYLTDIKNTAFYERIKNYEGDNYLEYVLKELDQMPEHFIAYKKSIQQYINQYKPSKQTPKEDLLEYIDNLNKLIFVHYNRISFLKNETFREEVLKYLDRTPKEFFFFTEAIKNLLQKETSQDGKYLKTKIYEYLAPLRASNQRIYRTSEDGFTHYVSFLQYDQEKNILYEGGFRYVDYRAFIHKPALQQTLFYITIFFVVTIVYPLFFRGSLIKPLEDLLQGVKKVNQGDLTVKVPVYVQDEIGYLATTFNKMVVSIREAKEQLQDYANNLEEKVRERTAELNASLLEVKRLKQMQDGDYYLTSLLLKPLIVNLNKSKKVPTEFFVKQYKEFEFRGKISEIGGDICVTGNLRLGKSLETAKRYIVAMNGDAMGKSTQGAGGALVMGVVMNSIIARSARNDRVLDITPEQWLKEIYEEIHGIFSAFGGSMCISCVVDLIEEETGKMYYFNAEHPYQILYRNGKATFIEEEMKLRKLGLESDYPFEVKYFQLEPGDVIIAGSDGRDDIEIEKTNEGIRMINENEYLILEIVEEAKGNLQEIYEGIKKRGKITDDVSLLKIHYQPKDVKVSSVYKTEDKREVEYSFKELAKEEISLQKENKQMTYQKMIIVLDEENPEAIIEIPEVNEFHDLFLKGNESLKKRNYQEALSYFEKAYEIKKDHFDLNRTLAILAFKTENYEKAITLLEKYLQAFPDEEDFWLYLSIAYKKTGNLEKALETCERAHELNPNRIPVLLQLADLHYKLKHIGRANIFLEQALEENPNSPQALKLKKRLEKLEAELKSK
ncbi:MAG: SpoIIE family protein phosphatase [Leptospiraceae bacterium]|nr:SpoIIE family protein phosphatase [Leptospiraceae bacterium]MDW7975503.1 SpoIIE family protein phosphatase [Leptospiraceae bacterium]